MSLCLTDRIERITSAATGRACELFRGDSETRAADLRAAVAGRRVLVVGGAGSIGSATVLELLALDPAALAVLDPAENNLAELIRTVRAEPVPFAGDFSVEPLDYGSPLAAAWLAAQAPFDLVLSFAALKHVRSERDAWSVLRLLEVNLLKADRFLAALRRPGHGRGGVFFVSTDKAANPVSLMGASKRAMELLLWAHRQPGTPASLLDGGEAPPLARATTTRFANVAFSDGSLPWAFLQRIEKRQPLAAPADVRRWLVSPREAGRLCLLAALVCPDRHVLAPRLDAARHSVTFDRLAEATLDDFGYLPAWCASEAEARRRPIPERPGGAWPVLLTKSDTSGEKSEEEFIAAGEQVVEIGLTDVEAISAPAVDPVALAALLQRLDAAVAARTPLPAKADLAAWLAAVVPGMHHRETGASLDAKL